MQTKNKNLKPAAATAPITASPSPSPSSTPPDTSNATLLAYVQQTVTELDAVEVGLGADPPLSPSQKRHAVKLRKGGAAIVGQIANLAKQQGLDSAALRTDAMTDSLGKAQALQPLSDRLAAFAKHVDDVIFSSQSAAMAQAQQFYALLQRRAKTNSELTTALAPVAAFFAYRHRDPSKPLGQPTKPQVKATKKAVATLQKQAPTLLAGTSPTASPVAASASTASAPSPAAAPQAPAAAPNGSSATSTASTSGGH